MRIDTTNILFICGGAFVGLDKIVQARKDDTSLGFGGKVKSTDEMDYQLFDDVKPQDLTKFGLIPEFVGRVPIVVNLQPLDEEALVKILTEPKNALIKQYQKLIGLDGVKLSFEPSAVSEIASTAIKLKTGARGLRTIIENLMTDVMYEIPSDTDISEVKITRECVLGNAKPELIKKIGVSRARSGTFPGGHPLCGGRLFSCPLRPLRRAFFWKGKGPFLLAGFVSAFWGKEGGRSLFPPVLPRFSVSEGKTFSAPLPRTGACRRSPSSAAPLRPPHGEGARALPPRSQKENIFGQRIIIFGQKILEKMHAVDYTI